MNESSLEILRRDLEDTRKWCFELQNTQKKIYEVLSKHDKEFKNVAELNEEFSEFKREMLAYVKQIKDIIKQTSES